MSATVKLSSALPADFETNGLDAKAGRLLEEPDKLMACLIWIDVQKVTEDIDKGDHIPTVRIRRIEPLGDVDAVSESLRDLVQTAVQERTGRKPMPFEMGVVDEGYDPDQSTIDEA